MEQFEEQPCLHDENEDTAQETGHYKLPEGAVAAHKVDEDFWSAVDSAKKRSRYRERMRHAAARLCFMVLFVGIGIAISITSIRGSGWVRNLVTGDEKISFTLPVAGKPKVGGGVALCGGHTRRSFVYLNLSELSELIGIIRVYLNYQNYLSLL